MDPANNRIIYNDGYTLHSLPNPGKEIPSLRQACLNHSWVIANPSRIYISTLKAVRDTPSTYKCVAISTSSGEELNIAVFIPLPQEEDADKYLPLPVVSQKIIDNAQSGNTDAQAVTLAAAQAIVSEAENDATKAKEIEDEFERNADPKCSRHNAYMNGQASIIELRYNELKVDKLFLYRDYFKISTPHPSGYGSWEGHVQRYKFEQGVLKNLIVSAFLDGCPETIKARDWKDKPAPSKPDYAM